MADFLKHTAELVGSIGVLLTAAIATWGVMKRPWKHWHVWVAKATATIAQVDVMSKALGPNGGSSLYDKITATEIQAQISGARISWLCDQLDRPNFECAPNGQNVRINAAFSNRFGYSPAEMLGQKWIRMVYIDDRDMVITEWDHAISDRRMFESRYRAVTKSGRVVQVRVIAEPQPHASTGEILCWLGQIEIIKTEGGAVS